MKSYPHHLRPVSLDFLSLWLMVVNIVAQLSMPSTGHSLERLEVRHTSVFLQTHVIEFIAAIIGIRCFSRARLTKSFGLDDYLTLFALCIVLIYDSILSVAISLGYGNHIEEVSYGNKPRILFLLVISQCFAVYTFTLPKLAFVAILERLLNLRRLTRIILWSLTLGLLAYSTVLCAFWVVQCTPRAYQWNPENHPGSCWKPEILQDLSYFEASTSGALDFFLAVFPPFVIRKLQMPTYKKVMISASLGGGIVGTVVVIYKLTLIKEVNQFAVTDPTCKSALASC